MRHIYFRGQALEDDKNSNIKKGDWVYGDYITVFVPQSENLVAIKEIKKTYWIPVDPNTVGQCTDLVDNEDGYIYEGDHLRVITISRNIDYIVQYFGSEFVAVEETPYDQEVVPLKDIIGNDVYKVINMGFDDYSKKYFNEW